MQTASDNQYRDWVAQLDEYENDINAIQDLKKELYTQIRTGHGKVIADAVKSAMRIFRMDDQKREQREIVSAEAQRILDVVKATKAQDTEADSGVLPTQVSRQSEVEKDNANDNPSGGHFLEHPAQVSRDVVDGYDLDAMLADLEVQGCEPEAIEVDIKAA